jgi:aminoglycoside phosphotransferase (APT) family kinase protein
MRAVDLPAAGGGTDADARVRQPTPASSAAGGGNDARVRQPTPEAPAASGGTDARVRQPTPAAPAAYRGGAHSLLDPPARSALVGLSGLLDPAELAAISSALDADLGVPDYAGPPVWLHADLMPGNLLVDPRGRLAAVIDFATLGIGDPSCDLIVAWNLLTPEAREVFRAALGVDEPTWRRGRGRALAIAVIALVYYHQTNPAFADNARYVIREVLAACDPTKTG